jgi:hypothetical protein
MSGDRLTDAGREALRKRGEHRHVGGWCAKCVEHGEQRASQDAVDASLPDDDGLLKPAFAGQMDWPCTCGHAKQDHHFGDQPGGDGSYRPWCQWTRTCRCYAFQPREDKPWPRR